MDDGRTLMVDEGFVRQDGTVAPGPAADVTVTGNLHWPDEEAQVGMNLGDKEQERAARTQSYVVTLRYDGDETLRFKPHTEEAFKGFRPSSAHKLRLKRDDVWVDGTRVARSDSTA